MVNFTVNKAATTLVSGVYGRLGCWLVSAVVVAAMFSEQVASSEQVSETLAVNKTADTGQQATGSEPRTKPMVSTSQKRSVSTLESTIVGDKELPTVLTIVPWQKPEQQSVMSKPVIRQIETKFRALEVDRLNRELHYYQQSKQ